MLNFNFRLWIMSVLIFSQGAVGLAHANDTFTTQGGVTFTKATDPKFGTGWRAPNGAIWSGYQGEFANSGRMSDILDLQGDARVLDSDAAKACAKIGAELPTIYQYRDLLATYLALNVNDFNSLFPVPKGASEFAWTSNGRSNTWTRFAKIFPGLDPYGDLTVMSRKLAVFCVRQK